MKLRTILLSLSIMTIGYLFMGIEGCGSKEMTSAKMYVNQKQYDKALAAINAEIAKNPANAEAYFIKGNVLFETKQQIEMAEAYRAGMKIGFTADQKIAAESKIRNAWGNSINDGIKAMNKGSENPDNYRIAIDYFRKAATVLPDSSLSYYNIAISNYNSQNYNEVLSALKEYHAKKPATQETINLALLAYNNLKDFDGALAYLNGFKTSKTVNSNWVFENIAQTYISAGKADQALQAFIDASNASPQNEVLKYNIGVLYLNREDYTNSIKYFEEAVAIKTDYREAQYNLGVTYLRLGKNAAEANEAAYTKEKDRKKKEAIGNDKTYLEYYKKALPYLEAVKDSKTDDFTFWTVLGQVYTALGQTEKAKEAFDKLK
ncbi:MAG: tetratricopeptide repeat protein [Bacteroidetes bacterium]|nr:tetratricopeptide repeat protein [Bacteroidota bacterium]